MSCAKDDSFCQCSGPPTVLKIIPVTLPLRYLCMSTLLPQPVPKLNFGAPSPDRHRANLRAYVWNLTKEWLLRGAIEPDDEMLASDLAGPGFHEGEHQPASSTAAMGQDPGRV